MKTPGPWMPWIVMCITLLCGSTVQAQVACTSLSVPATGMNFGTFNLTSGETHDAFAPRSPTFNFRLTGCTNTANTPKMLKVCLGFGDGTGGYTGNVRQMLGSEGDAVTYQLYRDAAYTQVLGPSPNESLTAEGLSIAANTTSSIVIPAAQNTGQPSGTYTSAFSIGNGGLLARIGVYDEGETPPDCAALPPAAVTSGSMSVSVTLAKTCVVNSISPIAFSNVDHLNAPGDAQGSVRITCTNGVSFKIGINNGNHAQGDQRRMRRTDPDDTNHWVDYALYRDFARTKPWGDLSGDQAYDEGVGDGSPQSITVYARFPAQDTPLPGTYEDQVVVTLEY